MPKIAAANIEEHVRTQTARITAAARQLFGERGYARTDLSDIAGSVGLARNSLYRYFPNKDHILLACVQEDMEPYLEKLQGLRTSVPDPAERVLVWLDAQFELATGPAHATLELMAEIRDGSAELVQRIRELHQAPNNVLAEALEELSGSAQSARLRAVMISGMVLAATGAAQQMDAAGRKVARRELRAAVGCLLNTA